MILTLQDIAMSRYLNEVSSLRAKFDERNLTLAYQYTYDNIEMQGKDVLDCLEDIQRILIKDTFFEEDFGFRSTPVAIFDAIALKALKTIEVFNFPKEIERIKQKKSELKGLDQLSFEHVALLKLHAFNDGNGRVARFVLCKRLDEIGGKYFYRYLEKRTREYNLTMNKIFNGEKDIDFLSVFLKRIAVF